VQCISRGHIEEVNHYFRLRELHTIPEPCALQPTKVKVQAIGLRRNGYHTHHTQLRPVERVSGYGIHTHEGGMVMYKLVAERGSWQLLWA
jgi:hypothetical protein